MKKMPEGLLAYKRTPEFTETEVPAGLLKAHQTKAEVWGKIVLLEGELLYRILEPEEEEVLLSVMQCGIVEPQVLHTVEPRGKVRFYVEFFRASAT